MGLKLNGDPEYVLRYIPKLSHIGRLGVLVVRDAMADVFQPLIPQRDLLAFAGDEFKRRVRKACVGDVRALPTRNGQQRR